MTLTPKNWKSFQHYKDRSPAWIKLHKGLMTDFAFNRLPLASRALAPMLWLLASEYENGEITASVDEIAFRLHVSVDELNLALKPLIDSGFFVASEPLAEPEQRAILEKRREEDIDKRTSKEDIGKRKEDIRAPALVFESDWPKDYREQFWQEYPKRVDKQAAFKKLEQIRRAGEVSWSTLIGGVQRYAGKVAGRDPTYTKGPAAWLNAGKWDDEDAPAFLVDDVCPPSIYRGVL